MQLLFLSAWLPDAIWKAIGWTLLHSLWLGILAAVLAGIIIVATRRSSARLRYNLLGISLILFLLANVVTFCKYASENVAPAKIAIPISDVATDISYNQIDVPSTHEAPTLAGQFTLYFNTHAELFVLTWAIFFLFHSIKLITGLAGVQRVRNYKKYDVPDDWQLKLQELGNRLGIQKTVRLFQSELVKVPVAIGFLKPAVLVPLGLLAHLPPDQAETILLHELAHIRRHDYVVNFLQRITEAVFFFNPALLWISSLIRQEREACCDDIVMSNTNSKGSYLEALVSFQEYSLSAAGYAMAISNNRNYLLNRVKRMITRENKKLNFMEKILLVISLMTITAFTWIPVKEAVANKQVTNNKIAPAQPEPAVAAITPIRPKHHIAIAKPVAPLAKKDAPAPILSEKRDTVPPKKINTDDLKFKSISTVTNDDLNTRRETVTATDQNGKTYMITKVNDKITDLTIDNKAIPENERENYAPLIQKLGHVVSERRAMNERERIEDKRMAEARQREREASRKEEHEYNERKRMMEKMEDEHKEARDHQKKEMDEQKKAMENQWKTEKKDWDAKKEEIKKDKEKNEEEKKRFIKEIDKQRKIEDEQHHKKMEQLEKEMDQHKKDMEQHNKEMEDRSRKDSDKKRVDEDKQRERKVREDRKDDKSLTMSLDKKINISDPLSHKKTMTLINDKDMQHREVILFDEDIREPKDVKIDYSPVRASRLFSPVKKPIISKSQQKPNFPLPPAPLFKKSAAVI